MTTVLCTNGNSAAGGALGPIARFLAVAQEMGREARMVFRAAGSEKRFLVQHKHDVRDGYAPHLFGLPPGIGNIVEMSTAVFPGRPIPAIPDMEFVLKLKGMLNRRYIETTFREDMRLLEDLKPDCIYGSMDLIMPIAAKKTGIRYIPIGSAVMLPGFNSPLFPGHQPKSYLHLINPLLKKNGLPSVSDIKELLFQYYASKILVPNIPEMEELPMDARFVYTGSILPAVITPTRFHWEKKRPLIFVYLSVGQITPKIYMKVLVEAFADSEFDVIAAAGDHPYFRKHEQLTKGNVHFFRFVPSEEILENCDVAIHHGGQNTTVQVIKHEVPAIIYPGLHFERHFNARKAAEIGCARILSNEQFTSETLLNSARKIIADTKIKSNLRLYSSKITSAGGRKRAADVIIGRD